MRQLIIKAVQFELNHKNYEMPIIAGAVTATRVYLSAAFIMSVDRFFSPSHTTLIMSSEKDRAAHFPGQLTDFSQLTRFWPSAMLY